MNVPTVPQELLEFLRDHKRIFIVSHVEPDGDCIASSLALASYLRRAFGHEVTCCNAGPFQRREIDRYKGEFVSRIDVDSLRDRSDVGVVIVDCSGPDRVGALEADIAGLPTAVIDHHATNSAYGEARFVVTTALAACYLVHLVIEALGGTVTKDEAQLLLFGISTDTGYFRHSEADAADLFASVSRLMAAGASPKIAHAQMSGGHTFATRKLLATLLARAESIADGAGVVTWETRADVETYGKGSRDSDTLYQLLFAIEGVRFAALVRYESETQVSGSLRSSDTIDVSTIATRFGGGGHKRASGFMVDGTLEDVVERVREGAEALIAATPTA